VDERAGVTALRTAVVGVGQVGHLHARVVSECDATELVAIVDPSPRALEIPQAAGATRLASTDALLEDPPDLAIVAVPTAAHAEVALPLIEAGVPVLVEKPIAGTVEDANAIIDAAERRGVVLGVGHVERYNPAVRALAEKLREGLLGRVFQVHARRLSPFPLRVGDAGVALDLATHDLDLMCEFAGRPLRVTAETDQRAHRSHEDLLAATLRFDTGIIGLLEVNWLTPAKVRQLTVTGERGMFVVDYLNQHLTLYENAQASEAWETIAIFEGVTEGNMTRFAIQRTEPLRAQLEAFVEAVRGRPTTLVSGADGLRAVRLALAAVEAGRSGRTVEL
jgi:UDP-N-acetylglucosamine 3-dehydrogenase